MKRKLTAVLLVICLLTSLVPAFAATAADVKGHWAESYIETLRSLGIMEGYPDGTFRPNNNVTKAELVTLLNRTFGLKDKKAISYTDVASSKWYYEQFRLATDYVFTFSGGNAYPDTALTRQEAASMFGRLMAFTDVGDVGAFADDSSISDWARTYIYAGAVKNLITGYPEGTFRPMSNITRAEVATVLVRLIGTVIDRAGTYTQADEEQNITVMASGVTLKGLHIHGDVYLTGSVGTGLVTLEDCQIDGEIIAVGNPGCTLILAGNTNNAEIRGDGMSLAVTGSVRELTVTSANQLPASLNITTGAAVDKLTMKTPGSVSGSVGTAYLWVSGVTFSLSPDYWYLNTGASVTIEGRSFNVSGARGPAFSEGYPRATVKLSSAGDRQTVSVSVNLTEAAQIYCIAVPRDSAAPTPEQVRDRINYGTVTVADANSTAYSTLGVTRVIEMSNLPAGQAYDIYVVAESAENPPKLGAVIQLQPNAAIFDEGYPAVQGLSDRSVTVVVKTLRTATVYLTAVLKGQPAPTAAQMQNGSYGEASNSVTCGAGYEQTVTLSGLTAGTAAYDVYAAGADVGGIPADVIRLEINASESAYAVTFSKAASGGVYPADTAVTVRFAKLPYLAGTLLQLGSLGAAAADAITLTAADAAAGGAVNAGGFSIVQDGTAVILTPPAGGWTAGCTYTLHFDKLADAQGKALTPAAYSFTVAGEESALKAPLFSPPAGTGVQPGSTITMSLDAGNAASGAILIYTIDGSDPRTSLMAQSASGQTGVSMKVPDNAVPGQNYRIRAYAYLNGQYSRETDVIYTVEDILLLPIATLENTGAEVPSGSEVAAGTVIRLSGIDEDAVIYYTVNGLDPTTADLKGNHPLITVTGSIGSTFTVKAMLVRGEARSQVYTFTYLISGTTRSAAASTPVITKGASADVLADRMTYNLVKGDWIYVYSFNDCTTTQLYYTLDGTDPANSPTRLTFIAPSPDVPLALSASSFTVGAETRLRLIVFNTTTGDYSAERDLTLIRTE